MSAEIVETTAAAPAETPASTDAPAETTGDNTKPQEKPKRQRKAPEEIYDLTQPIPPVQKPDKDDHDKAIEDINNAIEALKVKKTELQKKIDQAGEGGGRSGANSEREELKALRKEKSDLIGEKKKMQNRLNQVKKTTENLLNDRKNAKANVRYDSPGAIEVEIKRLRQRQETSTMSLMEEKRLLKEIDALQASKPLLKGLAETSKNIDSAKEERTKISKEIKSKDAEIDAVQEKIKAKQDILDKARETEKEGKKHQKVLIEERDALRTEIGEKIGERNKERQAFREANDKFYDYRRAIQAQRRMKQEEEKKKLEEEKAAYLAAKEAEEAKKIPYEEEMNLCDYLADYLSKTYLDGKKKEATTKKLDVVAVKDDPFAGLVPMKKKDDEIFMQMGKGKKPRVKGSKKKSAPVFKLNVDSFEQFGLLNLTPPTSLDSVQTSVDELRAKKKWYSEQPRGSVPTATDIRKANEKAAAKLRQGQSSSAPKKNSKLDISSDDFAPLSATTSTAAMNATWGQKATEEEEEEKEEAVAEEAAAPVETEDATE